jgi:hypothetical protein
MSIPVPLKELAEAAGRYGPAAFLLTGSDDSRPHATHVSVAIDGASITCELGRKTARNSMARSLVSLLWPPIEAGGYSLIVDGEISVSGSPGEGAVGTIVATNAVLHRPAPVEIVDGDDSGSDYLPIEIGE